MTIRKCIEQMRKVGGHCVYLKNGTRFYLVEMHADRNEEIGTFKRNADGSIRVMRRILCCIKPSKNTDTKKLEDFKKNGYWMFEPKSDYNYFHEDYYLLPERVVNEFISANNGIDEYQTISTQYYMMVDTMDLFNI